MKRHEDRLLDKRKARLCVGDHKQEYGIDHEQTFAPVADFELVRLILAIAAKEGLHVEHGNVQGAFLYGDINSEVPMKQPKEFEEHGKENQVC